mmetsp:Transcript_20242/g.44063  ORF Transcript_20242/g.44063 Transcript_20242/m.44063 type:complete len:217 (+) Transcript_20242:1417-2067(+)
MRLHMRRWAASMLITLCPRWCHCASKSEGRSSGAAVVATNNDNTSNNGTTPTPTRCRTGTVLVLLIIRAVIPWAWRLPALLSTTGSTAAAATTTRAIAITLLVLTPNNKTGPNSSYYNGTSSKASGIYQCNPVISNCFNNSRWVVTVPTAEVPTEAFQTLLFLLLLLILLTTTANKNNKIKKKSKNNDYNIVHSTVSTQVSTTLETIPWKLSTHSN